MDGPAQWIDDHEDDGDDFLPLFYRIAEGTGLKDGTDPDAGEDGNRRVFAFTALYRDPGDIPKHYEMAKRGSLRWHGFSYFQDFSRNHDVVTLFQGSNFQPSPRPESED